MECGTPLEQPAAQQVPTVAPPQAPPPAAPPPAPAATVRKKGRGPWIIVAVVVAALIVVGAVVGVVIWAVSGEKLAAEIKSVELVRKDGKSLDLEKVPLGAHIVFWVNYQAQYGKGGEGELNLYFESSTGKLMLNKDFKVKSSGSTQKKGYEFFMTKGTGEPSKAYVKLTVSNKGGKKIVRAKSLAYTAVKGSTEKETKTEPSETTTPGGDIETLRKQVDDTSQDAFAEAYARDPSGSKSGDIKTQALAIGAAAKEAATVEQLQQLLQKAQELLNQAKQL